MATIRLIPSTYAVSNTQYLTVSDASNMYYNTDHTANYATIRGRNRSNSTYYTFINGFNFSDVPSDAIVNGFTIKIKAYKNSYQSTGSDYRLRLCSSASTGSVISNTTLSSDLATGTTGAVYTFPNGNLTWGQLSGYGSSFSIEIPLRTSSNNQYPYVYVYGAEILVDYTLPTYHNVSASSDSQTVTVQPSVQSVAEGNDASVTFSNVSDLSAITVKDNGVDVTNSLVVQQHTIVKMPNSVVENTFQADNSYPATNGLTDTSSETYARLNLSPTQRHIIYSFDTSAIPNDATILSVSCQVRGYVTSISSNITTKSAQLYAGSTAKGSATTIPTSLSTWAISNVGTWTASEIQNIRLRFDGYYSGSSTYYIRFYGADLTITYELPQGTYTYTISDIQTDHTVVVDDKGVPSFVKKNSQYKQVNNLYKKNGNVWEEKSISSVMWKINNTWVNTTNPMSGKTAFKIE